VQDQPDRQGREAQADLRLFQAGLRAGQQHLGEAEAGPGQHQVPVDHLVVAADREILARRPESVGRIGPQERVAAVEAEDVVFRQIRHRAGPAAALEIAPRAEQPEGRLAEPAGDQGVLGRVDHPDGDVGIATQTDGIERVVMTGSAGFLALGLATLVRHALSLAAFRGADPAAGGAPAPARSR